MKHIKLFENFETEVSDIGDPFYSNQFESNLEKVLRTIVTCYKTEVLGSREHLSEYFDDGKLLINLAEYCGDEKISSILNRVADASMEEYEGSSANIMEEVDDSDCDYIAQFLGLTPLSYEEDWTVEEEKEWYDGFEGRGF
jgi:hypothetical protein